MYKGDGSYTKHNVEVSLYDLIKCENEYVTMYNNACRAYNLSNSKEKQEEIKTIKKKLDYSRLKIREYLSDKCAVENINSDKKPNHNAELSSMEEFINTLYNSKN